MMYFALLLGSALSAVLVFGLFIYALSKIFNNQQLESFARLELSQLVISAILAIIMSAAYAGFYELASAYVGGSLYSSSTSFLRSLVFDDALPYLTRIQGMYSLIYRVTTSTQYVGPSAWSISFRFFGAGSQIYMQYLALMNFVALTMVSSLQIQLFLLSFVGVVGSISVGLGVVLRVFPFIRKAGHFLIGFGFAIGIVYPLMYSLIYLSYNKMDEWQGSWWSTIGARNMVTGIVAISQTFILSTLPAPVFYIDFLYALIDGAKLLFISLLLPTATTLITIATISSFVNMLEEMS